MQQKAQKERLLLLARTESQRESAAAEAQAAAAAAKASMEAAAAEVKFLNIILNCVFSCVCLFLMPCACAWQRREEEERRRAVAQQENLEAARRAAQLANNERIIKQTYIQRKAALLERARATNMPLQDFVRLIEYEAQQVAFALARERNNNDKAALNTVVARQRDDIRRLLVKLQVCLSHCCLILLWFCVFAFFFFFFFCYFCFFCLVALLILVVWFVSGRFLIFCCFFFFQKKN